jgi:uncharacterized protein (DUF2062 family)
LSVAFGVFMGIVPIWGYQLVAAIVLAKVFRLNLPIVIVSANISIPPNIPLIIYFSMWCGAWFLGLDEVFPWSSDISIELVKTHLKQYLIGSSMLSVLAAAAFGSVSYLIFMLVERKK